MEFDPEKTEEHEVVDQRDRRPAVEGFVLVWSGDRPIYEPVTVGRSPTWIVSPGGLARATVQVVDDGFLVTPIAGRVEVNGFSRSKPSSCHWDSSVRVGDLVAVFDRDLRLATGVHTLEMPDRCFGPEMARCARRYSRHVEIVGEVAAGKRTFARALHATFRPHGRFVELDVGLDIDRQLEAARGGTLFFANVDEMPEKARELYRAWSKRVAWDPSGRLEDGAPFRVIGSVSMPFGADIAPRVFERGSSRARVSLPPLRQRYAEIPWFLAHVAREIAPEMRVTADLAIACMSRMWAGNFPQLRAAIRFACDHARNCGRREALSLDLPSWGDDEDEVVRIQNEEMHARLVAKAKEHGLASIKSAEVGKRVTDVRFLD